MPRKHRRSRYAGFPSFLEVALGDGAVIYAMKGIPAEESDAHVRSAEFRIPLLKQGAVATATVSNANSSNSVVFVDYAVTINHLTKESQTQVVVHTVWVDAGRMPPNTEMPRTWLRKMKTLCHVHVVGVLAGPGAAGSAPERGKRRRR
ncbi:MAG: hypothetical protein O2975_05925 [Proteobacteria bacterium]|nr:hypothetical protein [Pseudomonadota bacterium]